MRLIWVMRLLRNYHSQFKTVEIALLKPIELGVVAQIIWSLERALRETDFRRCVQNGGGQVWSSG